MVQTMRDMAVLIDWRLGRIHQLEEEMATYAKKMRKVNENETEAQKKSREDFYQKKILIRKQDMARLKVEIAQMDPNAQIRVRLLDIYLKQLEQTKSKCCFYKIENMELSPSTLTRILIQRLNGQFANQKLCSIVMRSLASSKGQELFGRRPEKERE